MAIFPSDRYTPDAIYVLSNGYYIDLKKNGPELAAITKTPEGATWREGDSSFSSPIKLLVEEAILNLENSLGVMDIELIEIVQKQTPPPPPKNIQFELSGRIIDHDGSPIIFAQIKPTIIEFPPPPPNTLPDSDVSADPQQYTNFEETSFTLGSALVIAPISVDENGNFTFKYEGGVEIDFSKSFIEVTAPNFFPKTIGPTLTKTGKKSVTKSSQSSQFTGNTSVVDTQLTQQSGGNYKSIITLKNNSTGEISIGEAISLNREAAKKIARSKAEQGFTQLGKDKEDIVIDLYNLGRIRLQSTTVDLEQETTQLKIQVQEGENKAIELAGKRELGFEFKLVSLFTKQKENIKRVMLPFILNIISEFGPSIVHSIISNKKNALDDTVCPDPEEIRAAIKLRNKLVRDLNRTYKIVRTVSKVLKVTNALLIGLKIGLTLLQTLSAIPSPFGLKAFYSGLMEKGFKISDKALERAGIAVTALSILATTIGVVLGAIIDLLNKLDFMLQSCSEEQNEDGTFKVPFIEINNELNTYINSSTGDVENIIDPLTNKPLPYKGFSFEIKTDTSQDFQYPKRYAIARNIQGIQMLRSESSFASSPEVLIQELKFVIDRDNLRAD